jgi:hypothetical protein
MDDDRDTTTRDQTRVVVLVSLVATGLIQLIWVPILAVAQDGFRPMSVALPIMLLLVLGTVPGLLVGLFQLTCRRPRTYGLLSIAASALPYGTFLLSTWLLLTYRGIRLGD